MMQKDISRSLCRNFCSQDVMKTGYAANLLLLLVSLCAGQSGMSCCA